jgi:N-acetylmuramoyl-L-alanine amidase
MLRVTINILVIALLLSLSANVNGQKNDYSIKKIVIDPATGVKTLGQQWEKTYEKDIALDVSLRAGKMIKKMYPEVEIIYTRDKDIFIPLGDRPEIANKNKADLFISVHVNICGTPGTTGAETYILDNTEARKTLKLQNSKMR